uniref:Putative secreted protein n=1 Tax=Ixodes scapularis TaxID=6945 RepID=A0A4D5RCX2_IXOSC
MPCFAALAPVSDGTAAVVAATAPPILSDSLGSSQILNPCKVPASTAGNICEGRGKTRAAFHQSLSNP